MSQGGVLDFVAIVFVLSTGIVSVVAGCVLHNVGWRSA
jgi:hypothetical protein